MFNPRDLWAERKKKKEKNHQLEIGERREPKVGVLEKLRHLGKIRKYLIASN